MPTSPARLVMLAYERWGTDYPRHLEGPVATCLMDADADLLVLEGMYGDEEKRPQALKNHHMMFAEAAEIAREAGPAALLLTHFSTSVEDPEEYLPAARAVFANTYAAKDGETVTLRYPKEEEKAWISLC